MRTAIEFNDQGQPINMVCSVPHNMVTAFLSSTGKSLVWRVKGSYITARGIHVMPQSENDWSPYIHSPIYFDLHDVRPLPRTRDFYGPTKMVKWVFNGIEMDAIKLPVAKIR